MTFPQTPEEFLRLAVLQASQVAAKAAAKAALRILHVPNGTRTRELCDALAHAVKEATGVEVRSRA